MDDVKALFERQARWQRSRAKLSWTEKLRMAEILRETALAMKSSQMKSASEGHRTDCDTSRNKRRSRPTL